MSTILHYDFFLPHGFSSRLLLEFDFAADTLEHSNNSDSGLILSCSDDRLLSSYSKSKAFVVIHS